MDGTGSRLSSRAKLLRRAEFFVIDREMYLIPFIHSPPTHNTARNAEFFVIDREMYERRPDLINSGRTLIGAPAIRGQVRLDTIYP